MTGFLSVSRPRLRDFAGTSPPVTFLTQSTDATFPSAQEQPPPARILELICCCGRLEETPGALHIPKWSVRSSGLSAASLAVRVGCIPLSVRMVGFSRAKTKNTHNKKTQHGVSDGV